MRSHARSGSTLRIGTWRAATAVTAHGKHQPLQWNIGSVHRYTDASDRPATITSLSALRYAPRYVYCTPFGRPVVPEVYLIDIVSSSCSSQLSGSAADAP